MSTGMPAGIWLNKFGVIIKQVFGHTAYHVGSSLTTKDWRAADKADREAGVVRIRVDDEAVERVARIFPRYREWASIPSGEQDDYRDTARAAIAALTEPKP